MTLGSNVSRKIPFKVLSSQCSKDSSTFTPDLSLMEDPWSVFRLTPAGVILIRVPSFDADLIPICVNGLDGVDEALEGVDV